MNYYLLGPLSILLHVLLFDFFAWIQLKTRIFTKIFGKRDLLVYTLYVVSSGIIRDYIIHNTVEIDSLSGKLDFALLDIIGWLLFGIGIFLNLWVLKALGWRAMYHGISFDYLLDEPITGGPFSLLENPQYFGSTLNMVGVSIIKRSPYGLVMALLMWLTYDLAVRLFEKRHFEEAYEAALTRRIKNA